MSNKLFNAYFINGFNVCFEEEVPLEVGAICLPVEVEQSQNLPSLEATGTEVQAWQPAAPGSLGLLVTGPGWGL